MSPRLTLLLVLVLSVAACSEAAEVTSTTESTPEPTTTETTTTTRPEVTETTETPTTTTLNETTTTTGLAVTAVDIAVTRGIVEQVERFEVRLDGAVRITVRADVSDEIHLHGYDIHADLIPGFEAVLEFDATIPGIFEIELEGSGVLIGELQVAP